MDYEEGVALLIGATPFLFDATRTAEHVNTDLYFAA